MGTSLLFHTTMRVLLALALFIAVVAATPYSTCEQKNDILKKAVLKLAHRPKTDCDTCYNDILAAATDCILSFEWLTCIEDVLGAGNPCIEVFVRSSLILETFSDKTGI